MLIGYARTSTVDQVAGLEAQEQQLAATGCTKLFAEQASSVGQRDQLAAALDFVREGDALVVTRLDRLAWSTADLLSIVATLEAKQVGLRIHANIHNHFNSQRHLVDRQTYKTARSAALAEWQNLVA